MWKLKSRINAGLIAVCLTGGLVLWDRSPAVSDAHAQPPNSPAGALQAQIDALKIEIQKIKDGTTVVGRAADADKLAGQAASDFASAADVADLDAGLADVEVWIDDFIDGAGFTIKALSGVQFFASTTSAEMRVLAPPRAARSYTTASKPN